MKFGSAMPETPELTTEHVDQGLPFEEMGRRHHVSTATAYQRFTKEWGMQLLELQELLYSDGYFDIQVQGGDTDHYMRLARRVLRVLGDLRSRGLELRWYSVDECTVRIERVR